LHRALIQHKQPKNRGLILETLKKLNRMDLIKLFLGEPVKRGHS